MQTEYELTALGRSLADAVATIRGWAYDNMDGIAGARRRFDDRAAHVLLESSIRR